MRGDMEYTQRELHKEHGYLVRIAPDEVSCSDPAAIKTIYASKPTFEKSAFYDAWIPPVEGYPGHFAIRNEKKHSERRRIVNSIYSMSSILESEAAIDSCTESFLEVVSDFSRQGQALDLPQWAYIYAFDVVGELFYGKKFGLLNERNDVDNYRKSLGSLIQFNTIAGILPSYLCKIFLMLTLCISLPFTGILGTMNLIKVVAHDHVRQRKKEVEMKSDERKDIIRKMIEIRNERGEKLNYTLENIDMESMSALVAGADTTAIAIVSVLYHLMRAPAAYEKLEAEVDAAFSSGSLSSPMTFAETQGLPYLKACINEAMRLHPSVGLNMPRTVPSGGSTISDFHFPGGYVIGANAAVIQYDTNIFGPDADQYNPERWINGDVSQMERAMIHFGCGSRTCIGKNIALSEIYKLVPELLKRFRVRLAHPDKEWRTHNFWFNKQSEVGVVFEKR